MVSRMPESRRGKPLVALIILVTVVALLSLFQWNRKQVAQEKVDSAGSQRLCEVRAEQAGLPGQCVYDKDSKQWVPKG